MLAAIGYLNERLMLHRRIRFLGKPETQIASASQLPTADQRNLTLCFPKNGGYY
jgi:hypothetical protein